MNLAFKREFELAESDALSGDAEKFFEREERLIAMDIHGDVLQMNLLNKRKLIASFRTDRFVTAKELWQNMNYTLSLGEKKELWSQVWSVPEANTPVYEELVHAIMKDPTKSSGSLLKKVVMVAMLLILIGGGGSIWWYVENGNTDNLNEEQDSISTTPSTGASYGTNPSARGVLYNTEDLFKKVSPSIVMFVPVLEVKHPNGTVSRFTQGHGSGFVIDGSGLIPGASSLVMTNSHVAEVGHFAYHLPYAKVLQEEYGIELLKVTLYGIVTVGSDQIVFEAKELYSAHLDQDIDWALFEFVDSNLPHLQLAAINPNRGVDIVVVGFRGTSKEMNDSWNSEEKEKLRSEFNFFDTSKLAEYVSPNKDFLPTLSSGKVSNIFSRPTPTKDHKYDVIEHSAMVSGGNSGGPMLNMYGEVTGMLTWGGAEVKNEQGAIIEEKDQALNLCIGIEEINKVLAEWQATRN